MLLDPHERRFPRCVKAFLVTSRLAAMPLGLSVLACAVARTYIYTRYGCRFVADIQAVADVGGVVIQVHRDDEGLTGAAAEHHSETVRDSDEFQAIVDHHIYNDGTLDDLQRKVAALLGQLREGHSLDRLPPSVLV